MTVLVVAAHPDDEVLGCGGTIARHAASGDEVHILIMAEGATSRGASRDTVKFKDDLKGLARAAKDAADFLGARSVTLHDFPDNRMDSVDFLDVVKVVEDSFKAFKPQKVYTHFRDDMNIDHRIVCEAVFTAARPHPGQTVSELLCYEVPSSTEWQVVGGSQAFSPNCHVNISETLEKKLSALKIYESEMREWPHARSIRAIKHLAFFRGASVGMSAAEAFMQGRRIISSVILTAVFPVLAALNILA